MSPQYGELRLTNGWDRSGSLGHPCKFQQVSHLGSVSARHSNSGRQQNFAALNRGLYIWQGGHHVGHWPTFLVSFQLMWPTKDRWSQVTMPTGYIAAGTFLAVPGARVFVLCMCMSLLEPRNRNTVSEELSHGHDSVRSRSRLQRHFSTQNSPAGRNAGAERNPGRHVIWDWMVSHRRLFIPEHVVPSFVFLNLHY